MRPDDDADAEAWVLTTDAAATCWPRSPAVAAPGPADLARWRKSATRPRTSPRPSGSPTAGDGARRSSPGPTGCGSSRSAWSRRRPSRSPGTRRGGSPAGGRRRPLLRDRRRRPGPRAAAAGVLAVDLDQGMARRARWNAEVYGVGHRVAPVRARAETFAIPAEALVHIDPDRRARRRRPGPRRSTTTRPGLDFLRGLVRAGAGRGDQARPGERLRRPLRRRRFEIELDQPRRRVQGGDRLVRRRRSTCRRRATRLPEGATWTDRDGPSAASPPVGAVLGLGLRPRPGPRSASGLLDGFAAPTAWRGSPPAVDS